MSVSLRSGGHGEQRIGALLGPADAAADLVELRQAEMVGAMHDQRIGVGNVEAGFDDGGRHQHVELAVVEVVHDVVELARRHLAVGDDEADTSGTCCAQELGDVGLVLDPRHDVERLPAAILFAQQRLADRERIEGRDEGADRQAIDRRRRQQRQVAHAGQRQLQRARDRRRRQRQHVDVGLELLQPLLVADAEMLLLVDDQQAEVLELDRTC